MSNKKIGNAALYLLFFANFVYAAMHGFNWLFYVSAALTAAVLVFDIVEVLKRGRKQ